MPLANKNENAEKERKEVNTMPQQWEPLLEHPLFDVIIQEIRKFPFINHISIHASFNNIAYQGDTSTKSFIQQFKNAFDDDVNKMTEFFHRYIKEEIDSAPKIAVETEPISSEICQSILTLSFPFFIKSLKG
ncbi:hypothetical protein [Ammoniphilus resinae]|uniref:Uncharacterized protein n=1 Tax=Ammoniphilus resinae TaxID=861532 RepID=A0ABS4GV01_9BACL|nr:hypothetical protein [Ammoniphilus resinae]MBP1934098.1 hypothetical protein [Ammoniphilus resinae]